MRAPACLRGAVLAGTWLLAFSVGARAQEDDELRASFAALAPETRALAAERFASEVAALDTLQNELLERALALGPEDPAGYPAAEPYPYYDPVLHAPDLAIPRERLNPDGGVVRRARERMFAKDGVRRLRTAWRYDWGARRVVRSADPSAPEHVFENGLTGHPPGVDLAEALLEAALDGGTHQRALAAFGHAYTDREGGVYPFTIYDAWCSGETMEMPDIDNLGIVHELLDDWSSWTSPVPGNRQESLYQRVAGLLEVPHRHRALRTALSRTFLTGEADLRDGFAPRAGHLHALWLRHESTPEKLQGALPAPADEEWFMADWGLVVEEDEALRESAAARQLELQGDARQVRELLIRIVEETVASSADAESSAKRDG